MNRQDLSNAAPGFKVAKKIINMPRKQKTKISKFPLYFEDFSFINLPIFNVFVVGLNELQYFMAGRHKIEAPPIGMFFAASLNLQLVSEASTNCVSESSEPRILFALKL